MCVLFYELIFAFVENDHYRSIEIEMERTQLENIYDNLPRTVTTFSIRQSQLELEEDLGNEYESMKKQT